MTRAGIHIPAINRTVSIGQYVVAIKRAKSNPDARFPHGLTCWWPCTGREIVQQYTLIRNERITAGLRITY